MFGKVVFTSLFIHGPTTLTSLAAASMVAKLGTECFSLCTAATANKASQKPVDPVEHRPRLYGQPTAETHPHLLKKGEPGSNPLECRARTIHSGPEPEWTGLNSPFAIGLLAEDQVTPGITREEYAARRSRLMRAIDQYAQHATLRARRHLVVVPSAIKVTMSEKIPYPFRQNSDFFYLSGFLEPDSCLVLISKDGDIARWPSSELQDDQYRSVLFVQPKDPYGELWDGPRTGSDGGVQLLGVDESHDVSELPRFLSSSLHASERGSVALWYDTQNPVQPHVDSVLKRAVNDNSPKFVNSPRSLLQHLRLIKSEAESRLMARSCEIASKAIAETIAATDDQCSSEHLLHARVDYECRARGAERLAYPPVVAGGSRATVIHYVANTQRLSPGELVLMDAGCEYAGYVSDLTRTWPVSNHFSAPHRELYEAVLDVQTELIRQCVERPSLDQLFNNMIDLLGDRLRDVGVVDRMANKADRNRIAHQYCPHHVGHFLGLDVHDTPLVPRSRPLQPGMVITVEPGVYIDAKDRRAPEEFRGLGIRIEDNVLIKEDGIELLSKTCPKTVDELLQLRQRNNTNERCK